MNIFDIIRQNIIAPIPIIGPIINSGIDSIKGYFTKAASNERKRQQAATENTAAVTLLKSQMQQPKSVSSQPAEYPAALSESNQFQDE